MSRTRASRYFRSATALGVLAAGLALPASASADPTPLVPPVFKYGPQVDAGHGQVVSVLHGRFDAETGQEIVAVADSGTNSGGGSSPAGVALIGRSAGGFGRTQDVTLLGDHPVAAVAGDLESDGGTSAVVVSTTAALPRGSYGTGKLESVDWHSGERHRSINLPGTPVSVAVGRFLPGYGSVVAVSFEGGGVRFYVPQGVDTNFKAIDSGSVDGADTIPAGPLTVVPRTDATAGDALVTASSIGGGQRVEIDLNETWKVRVTGSIELEYGTSGGAIASEQDPYGNRWYATQVNGVWRLNWFDRGFGERGGYLASDKPLGAPMVMNLYGGTERDVVATLDGNAFRASEISTERTTQTGIDSSRIATALDVDEDRRDDLIVASGTGVTLYGNDTGTYANVPTLEKARLTPSYWDTARERQIVTSKTFDLAVPTDTGDVYQCRIGDGTWLPCKGGSTPALSVPGDGSYKLQVRRMVAGTKFWSAAQSIGFLVETAKPAKPVLESQPAALANGAWFWLQLPASGTRVEYLVDGKGDWTTASIPFSLDLPDGPHRVSFRTVDVASGAASEILDADFTLDATAPARPTKIAGPDGPWFSPNATFGFEGEPDATFECRLDEAEPPRGGAARTPTTWRPCASPFAVEGLALGDHVLEVRQIDRAGNESRAATWKWTVLQPTPDVVVTPQPTKEPVPTPAAAAAPVAEVPVAPKPTPAPAPTPAPEKAVAAKLAVGAPAAKGETPVATATGRRVAVGCAAPGATDYRCAVTVTRGGKTVGTGRRTGSGVVPVNLDKATARKVQRLGGLKVRVTLTVKTEDGRTSKTHKTVRVLPRKVLVVPTDGLFAFDSAKPSRDADRLAKYIAGQLDGARTITIVGHTDAKGRAEINQRLGQERAEAFRRLLAKHGFDGKVAVRSAGDTEPRTSNDTDRGRALNRRVEIDVRY